VTNQQKAFTVLAIASAVAFGRPVDTMQSAVPAPDWGSSGELHAFHVQGNVHLLVGAGGNIAVQTGDEGVLVVDTGLEQYADGVLAAIRELSDKPIRYIVNTHFHADHTGGNEVIGKAGSTTQGNPTTIVAYENVLTRMSAPTGERSFAPTAAWPTSSYVTGRKDFFFNDEPILVFHNEGGHTDGDSIVFFRRSDVVMTGDLFVTTSYPVIDQANGGTLQGVIDGLNHVLDLTVPKHEQEGGTYVIPGHGRVGDEADVLEYRDMVTIIRDRIRDMVGRGLTLEQVKAERPTLDYDLHYGADTGPWTTAMFIEAAYKDLAAQPDQRSSQ
jgi:glyoxylase-like metal-dependent hydrolase (beta-lactamase superfamily II)